MMNATRMALGAVVLGCGLIGGCLGYASYPGVPGDTASNNPNGPAMQEIMTAGLRWVATKYPPVEVSAPGEARFAINLPDGVSRRVYEMVAQEVGNGAVPLSATTASLPIYHVKWIRIRQEEAQVGVFRPLTDIGPSPSGRPMYQEITVRLRGGLRPWAVVGTREWTPGAGEAPELNYLGGPPMETVHAPETPPSGDRE